MTTSATDERARHSPLERVLSQAEALAQSLAPYGAALKHLLHGDSITHIEARLKSLLYLAQTSWTPVSDLERLTGLPTNEFTTLAKLGIVRARDGQVRLTHRGENLITFLLFFQKNLDGAMSDGFSELVTAVLAGGIDSADILARIQAGSAARLQEELEDATATESLLTLDNRAAVRKSAVAHVERSLRTLSTKIDPELARELERAAGSLHRTQVKQEKVHVRIVNENVRYPEGYTHRDLINGLRGHSVDSLERVIQLSPSLFFAAANMPATPSLDAGLRPVFAQERRQPTEPKQIHITSSIEAPPPLPASWQQFKEDMTGQPEGALLHEIASTPASYFVGVFFAHQPKVDRRIGLPRLELRLNDAKRHRKPPYLDAPTITIHWSPA